MTDITILDKIRNKNGEPMLPFQKEAVLRMVRQKHNLLADDPGLGKSLQAIALWEVLSLRRVLVVTKATLKTGFLKHIENWQLNKRVVQIINKKTDFVTDLAEVVIVNYDIISHSYLHQQLTSVKWDLLICDESHCLKNRDAKRTTAVLAKKGLVWSAARTLMMTGTPILNRPVELYPILRVLAPMVIAPYSDYLKFTKRYCDSFYDGFTYNDKGASNTEELNLKLRQHYMIRRSTHEVEIQLPSKRYEMVFIDSSPDVDKKLKVIDHATRQDFKHQNLDAAAGGLATLRRETAEAKVTAYIETIKEYVESTDKIVIFAYHRSVIKILEEALKEYGCVVLHGGCSQSNRHDSIEKFKSQEGIKVFIGQIDAAGEGIDGLQNVCHNALFVEWSWTPGLIEQACKRLHRIGQEKPVLFRFLVWANTIEEHQMRVALDKVKIIREVLK